MIIFRISSGFFIYKHVSYLVMGFLHSLCLEVQNRNFISDNEPRDKATRGLCGISFSLWGSSIEDRRTAVRMIERPTVVLP